MVTSLIPTFSAPHLVCSDCERHIPFDIGGCEAWARIEDAERLGCGCGGSFVYTPVAELYRQIGVTYCDHMRLYMRNQQCPDRPDCWAKACPLAVKVEVA